MLEYLVVAFAAFLCPTRAEEVGFYITPNDTVECVDDLVKWCDGMNYPQEGAGMSMISVSMADEGGYSRVLCTADSDGTNCTKNGMSWFSCSKDNKFFYKGNQLSKGSAEGTDDDICRTASRAFNDLLVQNLSYDNETLKDAMEKGMESFFKEMALMQQQIEALNSKILSLFGNNFQLWNGDSSTDASIEDESATEENQLEQE